MTPTVLRGPRWRAALRLLAPMLTGIAAGQLVIGRPWLEMCLVSGLVTLLLCGAIGFATFLPGEVIVHGDKVMGAASQAARPTVEMAFDDIDVGRTRRRTASQRFFGYGYIWANDGRRILVDYFTLGTSQIAQILAQASPHNVSTNSRGSGDLGGSP